MRQGRGGHIALQKHLVLLHGEHDLGFPSTLTREPRAPASKLARCLPKHVCCIGSSVRIEPLWALAVEERFNARTPDTLQHPLEILSKTRQSRHWWHCQLPRCEPINLSMMAWPPFFQTVIQTIPSITCADGMGSKAWGGCLWPQRTDEATIEDLSILVDPRLGRSINDLCWD